MAAGFRSPAAIPLGLALDPAIIIQAGFRGLMGFWLGGASQGAVIVVPPTPEPVAVVTMPYWDVVLVPKKQTLRRKNLEIELLLL